MHRINQISAGESNVPQHHSSFSNAMKRELTRYFHKQALNVFSKERCSKKFCKFQRKHLFWSLFLIKLQAFKPAHLLKRDSNTGVFL